MTHFPMRQVHLDFHTSPDISEIGSAFDAASFTETLRQGHVNSVTVFAKCHHGLCYYPTKIGKMHPGLSFDLLDAMIDAAHAAGARAPIYITAGFSEYDAERHPEWLAYHFDTRKVATVNLDESADPDSPRPDVSWHYLCMNGNGYTDYLYALTEEICQRYQSKLDGLFYDIVFPNGACGCPQCREKMISRGYNPDTWEDASRFFTEEHTRFIRRCGEILHKYRPDATIFFNGGAEPYLPEYHPFYSHYEMEDLPTAWGGYDKLPSRAAFFYHLGKPYIGMTGKFQGSWGEFGTYKSADALKYEVAAMMACGAGCSVGDQMHPAGFMDKETYRRIGIAYAYSEQIEPYALPSEPTSRIGVYLTYHGETDQGCTKLLCENGIDYDVIYKDNFSDFDTVILPDSVSLDDVSLGKLRAAVADGVKVLFTGDSLIVDGKPCLDCGAATVSAPRFDRDYLEPDSRLHADMPIAPVLMYEPANTVTVSDGQAVATAAMPYFSRTYRHFCSHQNTPFNPSDGGHVCAVRKGNVLYLGHPIFRAYFRNGADWIRTYFINALLSLSPVIAVHTDLPPQGRVFLRKQKQNHRYCLHLLYASPIQKGSFSVLDDFPTLSNISISLQVKEKVRRVFLPLENRELTLTENGNTVSFVLDKLRIHAPVVIDYEPIF